MPRSTSQLPWVGAAMTHEAQGRKRKLRLVKQQALSTAGNELIDKAEVDPQPQKTNLWLPERKAGEGSISLR